MSKVIKIVGFFMFFVISSNANASLIGDEVKIDRRFENSVMSSKSTSVGSGIEVFNWQELYFDFYDYGIKMIPARSIGYAPSDFNGFDFYDLDFAGENEVISSVTAYFVSIYNGETTFLDLNRLDYTDNSISLDLSGAGFGRNPLYIAIETKFSNVPAPTSILLFSLIAAMMLLVRLLAKKNT